MTEIRAFVGHSFDEGDAEIVRKFLQFFSQLSQSAVPLTWVHAEAAEPKLLAEKVLSLIADKNVFIGICTRREYVVPGGSVVATRMPPVSYEGRPTSSSGKRQIGSSKKSVWQKAETS